MLLQSTTIVGEISLYPAPASGDASVISGSTRQLNIKLGSHRFGFSEDTWSGWLLDGRLTPEAVTSYAELGPLGRRQIPISIDAAVGVLALFIVTALLLMVALAIYSWRRSSRRISSRPPLSLRSVNVA